MRFVALALPLATLLSGCVDAPINPVSPAQAKLQEACNAGNTDACKVVLDKEQQDRAAYSASMRAMSQPAPQTDLCNFTPMQQQGNRVWDLT